MMLLIIYLLTKLLGDSCGDCCRKSYLWVKTNNTSAATILNLNKTKQVEEKRRKGFFYSSKITSSLLFSSLCVNSLKSFYYDSAKPWNVSFQCFKFRIHIIIILFPNILPLKLSVFEDLFCWKIFRMGELNWVFCKQSYWLYHHALRRKYLYDIIKYFALYWSMGNHHPWFYPFVYLAAINPTLIWSRIHGLTSEN